MAVFTAKKDMGSCSECRGGIVEGDSITGDGGEGYRHEQCVADAQAQTESRVEWRHAESVERAEWEQAEERRVAPLGPQGKCPVCFLELPLTRVCDDHGRAA